MSTHTELFTATESRRPDRFFVACIDGRQTMFVLHSDHTLCIATATPPVMFVESTDEVIATFRDLAV